MDFGLGSTAEHLGIGAERASEVWTQPSKTFEKTDVEFFGRVTFVPMYTYIGYVHMCAYACW